MAAHRNGATGGPPLAEALRLASDALDRLAHGVPLERGLEQARRGQPPRHPRSAAAAKDIAYTATRHHALTHALVARLAVRPPAPPVAALLRAALAQLVVERHAAYAVVDQAVQAARESASMRAASGFVNGVLRNALRSFDDLLGDAQRDDAVRLNLPPWWLQRLRQARPHDWQAIAHAQLQPPPLVLRVNPQRVGVDAYLARLAQLGIAAQRVGSQAVWLQSPRAVEAIPGFGDGEVAVQDAGAQLAAPWLGVEPGMHVLDACAAPGGKTTHLAECAAGLVIDAVESDPARAPRIAENLQRLRTHEQAQVTVRVADAGAPASFAPAGGYHRILLDAPCTASGIVRRHPDIPWLRRPGDVVELATQQRRLLEALWPVLRPAGRLLYVVCSLFPQEGAQQVAAFVARQRDARLLVLPGRPATDEPTVQLVPSDLALVVPWQAGYSAAPCLHDGFCYALIEKR